MAKEVNKTGKNTDGDIIKLCGAWGSVTKKQARTAIKSDPESYHVNGSRVTVVNDPNVTDGFYLRTVADGTTGNNLDGLPDC